MPAPQDDRRRPARSFRRPPRSPAAAGRPAPQEAPETEPEEPEVLPRLFKVIGAVVAPTTLLTGLLFYFGRLHITGFFRYFRVNFTVLDLTVNDYLIRSADGLFRPLAAVTVFGLLGLGFDRLVSGRIQPGSRGLSVRALVAGLAVAGLLLLAVAVADLRRPGDLIPAYPEAGGLGLAGGVLLVAYAVHLFRRSRRGRGSARSGAAGTVVAEWGLTFLLVSIGLFWAVGSYAIAVGTTRAEQLHATLSDEADAVLYSDKSLRLAVEGVTEVRCQDPDAAFRFRYDGLKLILQSGGQYVLVSGAWSRENGTAVLLPRSDSIRLEFAPPGQQRSLIC